MKEKTLSKGKRETKKKVQVNWQRVITLGAAGQYIQDRLNEELEKMAQTLSPNKTNKKK